MVANHTTPMGLLPERSCRDAETSGTAQTTLIEFWSPRCPACRGFQTTVEQLAEELSGRVVVRAVDVEREPELAAHYGVRALPTSVVVRGEQTLSRISGAVSHDDLLDHVIGSLSRGAA